MKSNIKFSVTRGPKREHILCADSILSEDKKKWIENIVQCGIILTVKNSGKLRVKALSATARVEGAKFPVPKRVSIQLNKL